MAKTLVPKTRMPWRHLAIFGWMPSPLKVWAYRTFLRYRIGRHVKIAPGAVVVGENVEIGDHVEIGLLTIVKGRWVSIGRHSSIGMMSYLVCERIEIGEDAKIAEQVFVGGPQLPESRFSLGSRTIVLQLANINPTKPVVIGDDTGIGGHCLIFTHGSWLNILDGYPVTFAPVTIGKSVWLPWRVFVMPGATIGDGSVIGGNSLVAGEIPPFSLAVGSPAKVVRSAPNFPRPLDESAKAATVDRMLEEFDGYVRYNGVELESRSAADGSARAYARDGKRWRLLRLRDQGTARSPLLDAATAGDTVLSESALTDEERARLSSAGAHWLDLAGRTRSAGGSPLTEELALFIGRFGIRLPREPG